MDTMRYRFEATSLDDRHALILQGISSNAATTPYVAPDNICSLFYASWINGEGILYALVLFYSGLMIKIGK